MNRITFGFVPANHLTSTNTHRTHRNVSLRYKSLAQKAHTQRTPVTSNTSVSLSSSCPFEALRGERRYGNYATPPPTPPSFESRIFHFLRKEQHNARQEETKRKERKWTGKRCKQKQYNADSLDKFQAHFYRRPPQNYAPLMQRQRKYWQDAALYTMHPRVGHESVKF